MKPILANSGLPIWVGLDLGLRHDATALVAVAWDGDRIRLVDHRVFVPREGETLDVEETAEAAVLSLRARFAIQAVYFDPWQALSLSQRLVKAGVLMTEYGQTSGNLTMMAANLLELIKRRQFVSYLADDLRTAVSKTVAIESSRGYRLGKTKGSDRIDPIIALAMACVGAVQAGNRALTDEDREFWLRAMTELHRPSRFGETGAPSAGYLNPSFRRPTGEPADRLYARGEDVAAREDAEAANWRRIERRFDRRAAW
jgi:phage terminase large subunit-like protein